MKINIDKAHQALDNPNTRQIGITTARLLLVCGYIDLNYEYIIFVVNRNRDIKRIKPLLKSVLIAYGFTKLELCKGGTIKVGNSTIELVTNNFIRRGLFSSNVIYIKDLY